MNILQSKNNNPAWNNDYYHDHADDMIKAFVLSLQIPKGSFTLDKSLGSDFIFKVKQLKSKNFQQELLYSVKKCANHFQGLQIENLEYSVDQKSTNSSRTSICVSISASFSNTTSESRNNSNSNKKTENKYQIFLEVLI